MPIEKREVLISTEQGPNKEYVRISDAQSGEVVDEFWRERRAAPSGRPKKKGRDAEFFRVYRSNWVDIIRQKKMTVHEGGFFMFMMGFVKWESNFLVHPETGENLTVTSLSKLLGMDRTNVADVLTKLNRKGFIAIVKRGDGRENNFLMNSNVAFFGKYLKDTSEHTMFDDVEYKPVTRISYKEPPEK